MPVTRRSVAVAAAAALLAAAPEARGFALIGSADLLVDPEKFWSFDGDEITWKFSANFLAAFPNAALHTQVRLAFDEWSSASASAERRDSPRYHWIRSGGPRQVYDLRSAVTHEIGHMIGSQHPDASWFNSDLERNFRYVGADLVAAPPLGGEIMNEGFQPGTLPATKPGPGISPGEYWRTLSKDELAFLDYVYGRKLTFTEVAGNAPAQIIVTAYNLDGTSDSEALGQGGPDDWEARVPGDPAKGTRILAASATMNANPTEGCAACSIGIDPSTGSWDVTNTTGKGIDRLSIRGQGTSNRQPLLVVLSNDPNNFTDYAPASTFELFNFENRGHVFSDPEGGAVPDGGVFGVAMQQDVWDWTVSAATTRATDGDIIPLSLVTFLPFYELGLAPPSPAAPGAAPGAILEQAAPPPVLARGLKLVNSDKPTRIEAIAFADVEGLGIDAGDVKRETWERLVREGRVIEIAVAPFALDAGEAFHLVFEGELDALPREVRERGLYILLDFPGLLDREILAWARSDDGDFVVRSLGLINDEPIVGRLAVPTTSTLLLLAPGLAMLLAPRRRRLARAKGSIMRLPLPRLPLSSLAALGVLVGAAIGSAQALVVTLGDQDYASGANVALGPYNAASAGEPAPFGGFVGDDNDTDFVAGWGFVFPAAAYTAATLRFGIVDHDSGDPGSQVALFGVEGTDLTATLDPLFEADAGHNGDVFVYSIALPGALLPALADGVANVVLALRGPTFSTLGVLLPNNGAGLDFAELALVEPVRAVPAPAAIASLGAGLAALAGLRRRVRRRQGS